MAGPGKGAGELVTPVLIRELSGHAMERDTAGAVDNALRARSGKSIPEWTAHWWWRGSQLPGGLHQDGTTWQCCVFLSLEPKCKTREMKFHMVPRLGDWPTQGKGGGGLSMD